ncbi:uncharacterized protein LOC122536913 [Frieseomelitta varia]|uniref:uncharacterized protein LOC122536913 n=1 Tax=Frieseomelitta varia TaxID=561572 RepID=UPI001CB690E1|nr:uncharacterized protein LOC122536913 [Frieseomelitta varia]
MLLHAACFVLLAGTLPDGPSISQVNAAPATYDQQQNGDLNVDAKFENFLVVVATSGSGDLLGNLASQVFRLNRLGSQQARGKQQSGKNLSETVVYETEDADGGREPYHVEIVHIDKEGNNTARSKHSDQSSDVKNRENTELSASLKDSKSLDSNLRSVSDSNVSIDNSKTTIKKIRSLWNAEEHHEQFVDSSIKGNKRSANVRNSQVENFNHSEDLSVKEGALRATRPGISLKKQLSKKEEEEEEEEDVPLISEERNELGNKLVEQELVLLGGGIENCGPGRYRDKLGICQTDKNFN